jgi:hypothetical protein
VRRLKFPQLLREKLETRYLVYYFFNGLLGGGKKLRWQAQAHTEGGAEPRTTRNTPTQRDSYMRKQRKRRGFEPMPGWGNGTGRTGGLRKAAMGGGGVPATAVNLLRAQFRAFQA